MKKSIFNFSFVFLLLLSFVLPNSEMYGQTHCLCCDCGGSEMCVPIGGNPSCGAACFFTPGCNPALFVNSNDPTCGDVMCPLPVELVTFQARRNDRGVELSWTTEAEFDNEGFEILRASGVNLEWEMLDFVRGYGNTDQTQEYYFLDKTPLPGVNYYKLRQIDFDGTASNSEIVSVTYDNKEKEIHIWRTIEKDVIFIRTSEANPNFLVNVFDMMGRRVIAQIETSNVLDVSDLPKGQYILHFYSSGITHTRQFVKVY